MKNKPIKVGFILHPMNVSEFTKKTFIYDPFSLPISILLNILSPKFAKSLYAKLPPHSFLHAKKVKSALGIEISIVGIMCCVFPEEYITSKENAEAKLISAIKLAIQSDISIIVLTGFTSMLYSDTVESAMSDLLENVIVTSGNTLTAALCVDGLIKACSFLNANTLESNLTILGATGDIGHRCSITLANKVKKLVLCSRNINEKMPIVNKVRSLTRSYSVEKNVRKAIRDADIIISATSSIVPIIYPQDVKNNCIICDVSLPFNTSKDFMHKKSNVFVFDGGKSKIVFNEEKSNSKWKKFCEYSSLYGCIAEGVLMGFDKNVIDSCNNFNEELDLDNLINAARLNGIELADFSFHNKRYSANELTKIKHNFNRINC